MSADSNNPKGLSWNILLKRILKKDSEFRRKIKESYGESNEIHKIFKERLDMYSAAIEISTDDIAMVLFSNMKIDVILELELFQFKKLIDEQMSQIISRQDKMEDDIKTIKKKLNLS